MARRLLFASLVCTVALLSAGPRAAGKRFITESDLLKFTWIADPQLSPDGSTVVFVRVTVNEKENRYESSLYVVPAAAGQSSAAANQSSAAASQSSVAASQSSAVVTDSPRRLTSNIRDTSPRWAPDGKRIAFNRVVEKDGKAQPPQVWLLAMDGGEARQLTELANGAGAAVWSPDGKTIAFSSSTPEDKKPTEGERKSDVNVVTRAVYRANGNPTYVDSEKHGHIFTLSVPATSDSPDAEKAKPKQITDGDFDEGDITWSRDGATIY